MTGTGRGCARVAGPAWAEGSQAGVVSEPQGQGFLWKDGSLCREHGFSHEGGLGVGAVTPIGRTWAGTKYRSILSRWQWGSFGHLSGTRLGADSWLLQGGALEKQTVAKLGALCLSLVFLGS